MEVSLDVSIVPMTNEQIEAILSTREPREEVVQSIPDLGKYKTPAEMIAAAEPLPDPVFGPGDAVPLTSDVGARLDYLDAYEANFKDMIEEMFNAGTEIKLTKEAIEQLIEKR